MNQLESPYITLPIEEADTKSGFSCGKRPLDDYFARHAFQNHSGDIGRAYVLRKSANDDTAIPAVLGFYTLNMAAAESAPLASILEKKLPKFPMPVALIGRSSRCRSVTVSCEAWCRGSDSRAPSSISTLHAEPPA